MNTEKELPELTDAAVERIEANVFSSIARQRAAGDAKGRRRRRRVIGGSLTAAAVVVAAIAITPLMLEGVGSGGDSASIADSVPGSATGEAADAGAIAEEAAPEETDAERQVIRTAHAALVVDDILRATDEITALAAELDGYVEQLGSSGSDTEGVAREYGWITLRIPADRLDDARASLDDIGDVASIEISENDVTSRAIDLEARIDSLQTSVDRLTDLIAEAGSVGDLLKAEEALSQRQADLESLKRELEHLDDQVAMSTFSIELTRDREAASTDPAGFGDGLVTGWNGLVGVINGLVVAAGFLLPWLGVAGVVAVLIWLVVRLVRRRR